jgi:hypothetical protein
LPALASRCARSAGSAKASPSVWQDRLRFRQQPRSCLPQPGTRPLLLGSLIDRGYLDSIGWRGIRIRRSAPAGGDRQRRRTRCAPPTSRFASSTPPPGMGAISSKPCRPCPSGRKSLLLRDLDAANVAHARALLDGAGLADVARCETGDAFAEAELAALKPAAPTW